MTIDAPYLPDDHSRCGFVTILGRPNVGKSTFVNQVLGYKLSAVTSVPHTTRRRWLGILSWNDCQIIFCDTPGIHESRTRMDELMDKGIRKALQSHDAVMLLCDPTREFGAEDRLAAEAAAASGKPLALVLNKADVADAEQLRAMTKAYLGILGAATPVFEISALRNQGLDQVLMCLRNFVPEGPFLYPEDQVADAFVRDIGEDLIRESAFELLREELPHGTAVLINKWDERERKIKIDASLIVEREAHKRIAIGVEGSMIQKIIKSAREKLGTNLEKFVELQLHVKVMPDWKNRISILREMGLDKTKDE